MLLLEKDETTTRRRRWPQALTPAPARSSATVASLARRAAAPSTLVGGNLVAAVIVGVNLGPNLTTIGTLATMLWLLLLRRRGLQVSALEAQVHYRHTRWRPLKKPSDPTRLWCHIPRRHPSLSQVQLVYLYGPPAVGKYTIGVELAARTGLRLLHNHLSVNLVSAVFDRDSQAWTPLLRRIRRDILIEATRHDVSLIMTGVFSGTSDHAEGWRSMLEPVHTAGGRVAFVQLVCDRDELFRRVTHDGRRALDKLVDPVRLAELLDRFDMFSPAPFGEHLRLDVTHLAPCESAARIVHYHGIIQR